MNSLSVDEKQPRFWACETSGCPRRWKTTGQDATTPPTCYTCAAPMIEQKYLVDDLVFEPIATDYRCRCGYRTRSTRAPRCYLCGIVMESVFAAQLTQFKEQFAWAGAGPMPSYWVCDEATCEGRRPILTAVRPRCYTCGQPMGFLAFESADERLFVVDRTICQNLLDGTKS